MADAIDNLNETIKTAKSFLEYLQQHPEALLRGRKNKKIKKN